MAGERLTFADKEAHVRQIEAAQEPARDKFEKRHGELVDQKYILLTEGKSPTKKDERELKRVRRYLDKMNEPYENLQIEIFKASIQQLQQEGISASEKQQPKTPPQK